MKRIAFLLILLSVCMVSISQKKTGSVYSEHEYIEKTRGLWSAFVDGDNEAMLSHLDDSVHLVINGNYNKRPKEFFNGPLKWWSGVDYLKAVDDSPAFPDAIEYKEGGIWVQDWLRLTGTHRKSGIKINIQVHNLYGFNEDGLISTFYQYFDDSFFDEIDNSLKADQIQQEDLQEVTSKIKEQNSNYSRYFLNGQLDSLRLLCAEDIKQYLSHQEPVNGLDELIQKNQVLMTWGKWDLELTTVEVKKSGQLVVERGKYKLTFSPNDSSPIPASVDTGNYLAVWEEIDGVWKIVWDAPVTDIPLQ